MGFGEKLSPTAAIASILSAYPFSVGLLRELLQNSDDAKASKQIFVLDSRTHATDSLYHHDLADAQGPALLACNDALFSKADWEAVQTIYESSKVTDTSKIGKYGVGFRSCYHVTDNPQILSGSTLAIFDPHHNFTSSGGATFDFIEHSTKYTDQLSGFDFFIPVTGPRDSFRKTVIRLPLRTTTGAAKSLIKKDAVEPSKIRQLFGDFIKEEIRIVLLFLTHISSIEIYEVDDQDIITCLAKAELVKRAPDAIDMSGANIATSWCSVKVTTETSVGVSQSWRVFHASYSDSDAAERISNHLGYDVGPVLQQQKLLPKVGIAMPLTSSAQAGRLYTYLPLPLSTGFPCHIHGLFALTPDRQHLRNGEETGVVEGVDSVLVAWNRLLFDIFVPSAWAGLLRILITHDNLVNIFEAWPPSQPSVQGGDTMYWNNLSSNVVKAVAIADLAVWPVITSSSPGNPIFSPLSELIVASETDNRETLATLASAGVSMTLPPAYIKDLLLKTGAIVLLNPYTVRQALLRNITQLSSMHSEPAKVDRILSYLLSTEDLALIVGLPLVRVISGEYITLKESSDGGPVHTLLTGSDKTVFGNYDHNAIDLTQLPPNAAELLRQKGPSILNVSSLTSGQVIKYLAAAFHQFNISLELSSSATVPDPMIDWLALFWKWLGAWSCRFDLFHFICALRLIPTSRKTLVSSAHGVFDHVGGLDVALLEALETAGILFLHPKVASAARLPLGEQNVVKSVMSGHHILNHISMDCARRIKSRAASLLRNHLLSSLANSRGLGPLNDKQQSILRCLPIYPTLVAPVLRTSSGRAVQEIKPIAVAQSIKAVVGISLIPVIEDTVFLDDCGAILEYLHGDGELLNADGVLSMAIDHMPQQPKHLQRAFVKYIVSNRDSVTNGLLRRLSRAPFVAVCGDSLFPRAPQDLFDPKCAVAALLPNDNRCPCISDDDDKAIVAGLLSLGLLRRTLADDIVQERIAHISRYPSAQGSVNLAIILIRLIVEQHYDCSGLDIDPGWKWLPTKDGLRGSLDCHHHYAHPSELFDEVLPALAVSSLSDSLVRALRWNEPIPLIVVKSQMDTVLQHGQGHKLHPIIWELSERVDSFSLEKYDILALISDRPWIPISQRCIASTSHAILSSDVELPPGFYQIPASLTDNPNTRQFLQLMGCSERPSADALLCELDLLKQRESDSGTVKLSLRLLEALVDADISDEEQARLLVPDVDGRLRLIPLVFFNDLGPSAGFVSLPDDISVGHPKLTFELAKRLEMTFIGHSELKSLLITDRDMGEALTSRIRSVLIQYNVEQAFTEFLANAADAKATSFGILLDDRPAMGSRVLSPAFSEIQSRPSLVIYNNSVFEDKDFDGILNVGLGGKLSQSSTIGQFGLGALSMYHFTEVAMIVSGDKVMFLDPSRSYLPFAGRTSASIALSDIRRLYSDHLAPLCGLYDFSLDLNYYPGTLFRLPLRTGESLLSPHSFSMHDLRRLVEGRYSIIAPQALLFTQVSTIKAEHRDVHGHKSEYWSIQGDRQLYRGGICQSQTLSISTSQGTTGNGEWHIVSCEGDLPAKFQPLVIKHRLRNPIRVGLAANLTSLNFQNNFFATMPLPISTQLPVQLSAPFILAPDRRSIRLDGEEEKYNRWLLSHLVPPLYLRLLEELLYGQHQADPTWWRWWPDSAEDAMSSALIHSLYTESIATTDRRICVSVVGSTISPRDAVFLTDANSAEAKLLLYLKPPNLVQLPRNIREPLGQQIKTVDIEYVKQTILRNADNVRAAFVEGEMTVRDIREIVRFLHNQNVENIVHLPLLPLANGSLATFERSAGTKCYYTWSRKIPSLFPIGRFVDSGFSITGIDKGLNVSKFDGLATQDLIKDRIQATPQQDCVTMDHRSWIDTFWSEFQQMNLQSDTISMFPLVPTTTPGSYISLQKCRTETVIVMRKSLVDLQLDSTTCELAPILSHLGATIVQSDQCHPSLRCILDTIPSFSMNRVLLFLDTLNSSVSKRFARLSVPEHRLFANWGRQNIMKSDKALLSIARQLPIWPALEGGMDGPFLPASGITMLPATVVGHLPDILRFLQIQSHFVEYSATLHHKFKAELMSFTRFQGYLQVSRGTLLRPCDMAPYKCLLNLIVGNRGHDHWDVLVPNSNRVLDSAHNLYARSEPLFSETFETQRHRLVHQDIQDLERRLGQAGLRTKLDFVSFKECVKVIDEDAHGAHRVNRARLLFQWYCDTLPILIAGHGHTHWRELDTFRFIPPVIRRRFTSFDHAQYVSRRIQDLELVSPREVLRPEHEAIAWTQRASFVPSDSLLVSDLFLGVPDAVEVLEHLRILTLQIARSHPSNEQLLSDIKKSYRWLEQHKGDITLGSRIIQYNTELLFLNVDDPERMDWTWRSASQLYINISDSPDSGCWGVRKFLMPFRGLLRLAGVEEVKNPTVPDLPISSVEEQLNQLKLTRIAYNDMRYGGRLTDVVFTTDSGEEFPAHRVVLAGACEHFQDMFLGQFGESNDRLDKPISVLDCSADCLRQILEYLYTGVIPLTEDLDMLEDILHLAHRWEIASLVEAIQVKLVQHVSLHTYDILRDEAEELDAQILVEQCDKFEKENQAAIRLFKKE